MTDPAVTQVCQAIDDARAAQKRIPAEQVSAWMRAPSLDVRALAFATLFELTDLVESPPAIEVTSFFRQHLLEAIVRNRPTTNFPSRYMAADSLRAWFQRIWATDPHARILSQIRDDLAALVTGADHGIRDAVITGILEHLFASPQTKEFFLPWARNPGLAGAYKEAARLSAGFHERHER